MIPMRAHSFEGEVSSVLSLVSYNYTYLGPAEIVSLLMSRSLPLPTRRFGLQGKRMLSFWHFNIKRSILGLSCHELCSSKLAPA